MQCLGGPEKLEQQIFSRAVPRGGGGGGGAGGHFVKVYRIHLMLSVLEVFA